MPPRVVSEVEVQILNNIGLVYAKLQDYDRAYEWHALLPIFAKSCKYVGVSEHKCRIKSSVRGTTRLTNKTQVKTLFSLAWVQRKRQKFSHARELFMMVLDLDPGHGKAMWLLGDILKTCQDFEGAIQQFQALVRTQPESPDGHVSLAQCYDATKQYSKAVQIYKNILETLCPGRTEVHFALGKDYFLLKQYRQAVVELDKVPDNDPKAVEARSYGAKACRELEDHERAISLAESAAHCHPHPEVMHFLGEEYARVGEQHKAAQCFSRGLELEPNHLPSLMELGQLACRPES
ncbi:TMTC1 [Symbiodinium natans]|uniref:TMTC1 protein n=1 Tax=Symbiodinium natans TaxID=878477 RepID=A0A812QWH3_9DINO|nr:TMTC1 [Symbiodinium natans]